METDFVNLYGIEAKETAHDINMVLFIRHVQERSNLTLYEMSAVYTIM